MADSNRCRRDAGPQAGNRRRGSQCVAALALVGALVGCSASAGANRQAATAADEYRTTVAQIEQPLPAGRGFPPGLPKDFVPAPGEGVLEAGAARNQAWFTWLCAWEADYLTATDSGQGARAAQAASKVEWWATGPFYKESVGDPDGGWVTNVVKPLRAGDSSGVRTEYQHMCPSFPTVGATA